MGFEKTMREGGEGVWKGRKKHCGLEGKGSEDLKEGKKVREMKKRRCASSPATYP